MKGLIMSLLMVIGTPILSFSQTSYPKKILWESDTVLVITKPQLVKINRYLNGYTYLEKVNEGLNKELLVSDSLRFYWREIALKNEELFLVKATQLEEFSKINESLQASLYSEKKKVVKIGIGVGAGGILLGLVLRGLLR